MSCLVCVPHSVPSMARVTILLLLVSVVAIHSNPLQVLDNILRRYSRITLVLPTLKKANTNFMLYLVRTGFPKIELVKCKKFTFTPRQIQETNEKHISKNRFNLLGSSPLNMLIRGLVYQRIVSEPIFQNLVECQPVQPHIQSLH